MRMARLVPSRRTLLWGGAALLALAALLYAFLPGVLERAAVGYLERMARDEGFSEFRLVGLRLSARGEVEARGLRLAGTPDSASQTFAHLELTTPSVRARIRWKALLVGGGTPPATLSEHWPAFLEHVETQDLRLAVAFEAGAGLSGRGVRVVARRRGDGTVEASLGIEQLAWTAQPEATVTELSLEAVLSGSALELADSRAQTPWGEAALKGRVEELAQLLEALREPETTLSLPSLFSALEAAGVEWTAVAWPRRAEAGIELPAGLRLELPERLELRQAGARLEARSAAGLALEASWGRLRCETWEASSDGAATALAPVSALLTTATPAGMEIPLLFSAALDLASPELPYHFSATTESLSAESLPFQIEGATLEGALQLAGGATGALRPAAVPEITASLGLDARLHLPGASEALPLAGNLQGRFDGAELELSASGLQLAGGSLDFSATAPWQDGALGLPVFQARLSRLPARLLSLLHAELLAEGLVDATAEMREGLGVEGRLSAQLADLCWSGERRAGPTALEARWVWDGSRLAVEELEARLLAGRLHGSLLWAGPTAPRAASLDLALNLPSVRALDKLLPELSAPLEGGLLFTASGGGDWDDLEAARLSLALESQNLSLDRTLPPAGLSARAELSARGVEIPAFQLTSGQSRLSASGRMDPEQRLDFRFSARLTADLFERYRQTGAAPPFLSELAIAPGGALALIGTCTGTLTSPQLTAGFQASGARYRETTLEKATGQLRYHEGELALWDVEAELPPSRLRGSLRWNFSRRAFLVRADLSPLDLTTLAAWAEAMPEVSGQVSGPLEVDWDGVGLAVRGQLACDELVAGGERLRDLRLTAESREGHARAELSARALGGRIELGLAGRPESALLLRFHATGLDATGSPLLAPHAAGVLDGSGQIELGVPWAQLTALDWPELLARTRGQVRLAASGTRLRQLEVEGLALSASSEVGAAGLALSAASPELHLWAELAPPQRRVRISGAGRDARLGEAFLSLSGHVLLDEPTPQLDLHFDLASVALDALEPLRAYRGEIGGALEGQGRITGPWNDPDLLGELSLREGRLRLPGLPGTLYDARLSLVGDESGLRLTELWGRMGRGTVAASGEVKLLADGAPHVNLALAFQRLRYAEVRDLSLEGDGRLALTGPLTRARLSGEIEITRGAYDRPFDWTRLVLARLSPGVVEEQRAFAWNPALDLALTMPGNFWVRNSLLSAELSGSGRLTGSLTSPTFSGRADVVRGAFQLDFARFQFERASALFEESRPFVPFLLASGVARAGGYVVRAQFSGEPSDLAMSWSSNPPLSEEEIVRLLSTGSVGRDEGENWSAGAAWILSQGLRHSAGDAAGRALPIDSVELRPVRTESGIGTEIVTQERLTERLSIKQYIGVEDPANAALGADLQISERVSLSGRARRNNVYILELIYEILF